jgi:hypothetical protein
VSRGLEKIDFIDRVDFATARPNHPRRADVALHVTSTTDRTSPADALGRRIIIKHGCSVLCMVPGG